MAKVEVKLKRAGFRALRNSPEVVNDLGRRAHQIVEATGASPGDYSVGTRRGKSRGRAGIVTTSDAAYDRNVKSNELLRAIDAGR